MSRITSTFADLNKAGKKGFVPFITAGDPNLKTTKELIVELSRAGATLIEVGVPFSDPVADGPVIQRASERALRNAFGISEVFEMIRAVRKETDTPLILFSYYNPLLQYGIERVVADAKEAGINGVLVTDLPPEECDDFARALNTKDLDMIFLVAPTTTDERLKSIAKHATGFIYAVSLRGVTGVRTELASDAKDLVKRVRQFSDLPVAVGFGISNAKQVAEVCDYADAAVVGSAIVAEIERNIDASDLVERVGKFATCLISDIR